MEKTGSCQIGSILFLEKGTILFPQDEKIKKVFFFPSKEDMSFWRKGFYLSRWPFNEKYNFRAPFFFCYQMIESKPWDIILSTRIQQTGKDYVFKGCGFIKEKNNDSLFT